MHKEIYFSATFGERGELRGDFVVRQLAPNGYLCVETRTGDEYVFPRHIIDAAVATSEAMRAEKESMEFQPMELQSIETLTLTDRFAIALASQIQVPRDRIENFAKYRVQEIWEAAGALAAGRPHQQ